jgi:hypothetical protein
MKNLLSRLASLTERVDSSEREIIRRARARHSEVSERLDRLRPQATFDDNSAAEYRKLTAERATLSKVIGIGQEKIRQP